MPLSWIDYFSADELEAAICGNSEISVEDWSKNTITKDFKGLTEDCTRLLPDFWKIMETYNQEELGRVL